MKFYVFVDRNTNDIKYTMSWGNKDIPENYPIPEYEYIICINEDIQTQIKNILLAGNIARIKNKDASTFEEMVEIITPPTVQKPPTEIEILKSENHGLKQGIAELTMVVSSILGGGV